MCYLFYLTASPSPFLFHSDQAAFLINFVTLNSSPHPFHSLSDDPVGLRLQKTREDSITLLLVTVAKLLSVCALLALGPGVHLRTTDGDEESNRPVSADDDDGNPRQNLVHVVGGSDQAEAISNWNLSLGSTDGAQAREVQMDQSITSLSEKVERNTRSVDERLIGLGSE